MMSAAGCSGMLDDIAPRHAISSDKLSDSDLNQLINGKHNFTLDMLVKIADGLDVPLADLFVGLDELPPHKLAMSYNRPKR